jgi:hypothetical protein
LRNFAVSLCRSSGHQFCHNIPKYTYMDSKEQQQWRTDV